MNVIIKAAQLATEAHAGQFRKYTNRPYIEHPMRVACMACQIENVTEEMVAVAWMHDVIEDCDPSFARRMMTEFCPEIVGGVAALTNPSKNRRDLNRAQRKELDRNHLKNCAPGVRLLKLLDRIDNIR